MVVLDTSFVVKFVKQEVPMSFFEEDKKFITTDLFDYEFANVMWKTAKYQGLSTSEVRAFFTLVESLEIERYKTDAIQLFSYATETGLTAYDASYLLLAKKYNCKISTFDKQLLLAAEKEGVKISVLDRETAYLMSNPKTREDILEGIKTPLEECVDKLPW